ncbi:MAG: GTP cyclohydrolase I FolE [Bacteroidales bacterium]
MKINGNNAIKSDPGSVTDYKEFQINDYMVIGDEHVGTSTETPMRNDAFDMSDNEKMDRISYHFRKIMETMGLDLKDDSLNGTPRRVAKMFINEIFYGLDPKNKPSATLFENKYGYNEMLVEKNIKVHSYCEHHFVPIVGKAHVAYISNGKVIGLSKINRIVDYFSRRPQVQERLTIQIAEELKKVLQTDDVAVVIDSAHMCVITRGVKDVNSSTVTASYHGKFKDADTRKEFLGHISEKQS